MAVSLLIFRKAEATVGIGQQREVPVTNLLAWHQHLHNLVNRLALLEQMSCEFKYLL
ncbi:MAG: hypothetical protein ACFBSC_07825 [Microcoleaceae cyanobacterium]